MAIDPVHDPRGRHPPTRACAPTAAYVRSGDIVTCKALCAAWGVCAYVFNFKTPNTTEANALSAVMTVMYAYLAWA